MNKIRAMIELKTLLEGTKAHPAVGKEIFELILGTGSEKEFIRLLGKQLEFIRQLGNRVIELAQFEKLKDYKNLYSMHLEGKTFNIRVLYSYGINCEIFLHCFYEKEGKSTSEYRTHAPIAIERLKEMEDWI
ncbi:MAG: hypothetical protein K0S18_1883 [Anaerocolumna sp.]|jgi:hypothetical protein|nr:hypothetical protein [Anaerocolumna sp.]